MVDWIANSIVQDIRGAHLQFDSEELEILPQHFSFKFHEPNQHDQLTCDIIVRIRLRYEPYDELEGIAAGILMYIHETLEQGDVSLSVGVEIMLAEKAGWCSSKLQNKLVEEEL